MHGLPALAAPGIEGAGKAAEEGDALGGLWVALQRPQRPAGRRRGVVVSQALLATHYPCRV